MIEKVTLIIGIVAGLLLGSVLGVLGKTVYDQINISNLKSERDQALLAKRNMQDQWEKAVNELEQTRVLLNDTLAALELLREYQIIDEETRKKMNNLDNTLDPSGNPTDTTYDEFRKLVDEYNKKNNDYNTAMTSISTDEINLQVFIQLKEDAEELFKETTDLLILYKEK